MRLGLIADVHEAVESLHEAFTLFHEQGVEEIIFLGDVCRMHRRLEETVAMLVRADAAGVWGNHDYGLCRGVDDEIIRRYSPQLLRYMGSLQPWLIREDCLFTHVEPYLDANDLTQLW